MPIERELWKRENFLDTTRKLEGENLIESVKSRTLFIGGKGGQKKVTDPLLFVSDRTVRSCLCCVSLSLGERPRWAFKMCPGSTWRDTRFLLVHTIELDCFFATNSPGSADRRNDAVLLL